MAAVDGELEHGVDLQVRRVNGFTVLAVRGDLDAHTVPLLDDALNSHLAAAATGLLVDLSELDFLSSVGMSLLLEEQSNATRVEKRFGVIADGSATSRPMKLMGLDQQLSLYPTLEEALERT